MELTYPVIIYAGIAVLVLSFLITFISVKKYKGGRVLANADIIKEITYYKWLVIKYGIYKFIMTVSLMAAICVALFLATKPTIVRTETTEMHNRDIFICFDVSTSLDGINIEMCEQLKEFVENLKGERFGISMFNATSILVLPLTSDYEYVIDRIDMLEESIIAGEGAEQVDIFEDNETAGYRFSGTLISGGSSMIGDGLATCLYDFPALTEEPDRARLIVFITDNNLNGIEIVNLEDACRLCAYNNVKVFGLAPDEVVNEKDFANSIYLTGGYYYNTRDDSAMDDMLEQVKKTDVNTEYKTVTTATDVPEKGVIALVICVCLYMVAGWRIKL